MSQHMINTRKQRKRKEGPSLVNQDIAFTDTVSNEPKPGGIRSAGYK
jgi:hypothetical protein